MEHTPRDDGVPVPRELLELRLNEPRARGRVRIDAERVVPGVHEERDETAFTTAADLEDAPWRWR